MISEKLMMSLFALDAYSRSTPEFVNDVRLFGLGGPGTSLGGATVENVWNVPNSSFVAVEYSWNGKTVLSFRGTDRIDLTLNGDIVNGWSIGAGIDAASQVGLAEQVYEEVTGQSVFSPAASDVILTGHSLGGGLAGYLSALSGAKAYGFDHMTFGPAAERALASHLYSLGITDPTEQQFAALGLRLPDANQFLGTHVAGEVLVDLRNGNYAAAGAGAALIASLAPVLAPLGLGASWLLAALSQSQAAYEQTVSNSFLPTFGWNEGPLLTPGVRIALHSQGLLVLLQFAQDEPVGGQWISSGFAVPLLDALYKDSVALSVGINQGNAPGAGVSGQSNPADLMLTKIAYSVLDSGAMPFGDSAIRSLFNDAESVGDFLNNGGNALLDVAQVADNIARFAALQAQHSVTGQQSGFVSHSSDMLLLDHTQQTWTFGDLQYGPARYYRDLSNVLLDGSLSGAEKAELDLGPNRSDAEYYSNAAGGWHGQVAFESALYTVKSVGTATSDEIIGTNGDEQFLLGAGDDSVTASGGINWINGGDGTDKLIDEHAWSEFEIQFDAVQQRYYFALRDSGADPRVHILDDMELFQLDGEVFNATNVMNVGPDGSVFASGGLFYEGVLAAGSEVARLGALDGNAFDAFTWTLHPDTLAHYYLDGNIVRALHDITFDYEAYIGLLGSPITDLVGGISPDTGWQEILAFMQSAYVVKVTVEDSYGLSASTNLAIGVANVNEAPQGVRIVNTGGTVIVDYASLPENLPIGTLLGTALAEDPDGGPDEDQITWSLVNDAGGRFRIDAVTGEIFVNGVLDYQVLSTLELIARATDEHGAFGDAALIITLKDVEEVIDGTASNDTLHGTPEMDVINGLGGHDTINGYEANDRLYGGSGNDILYGGLGSDAMFGEADNDIFHIGEAEAGDVDYVNGGAHTGTGDVVEVSVGATYRLDAAGAAAIRNQIVANGFTAPTGHGIGIEMAVGDAFVQGVEIIRASADANELVIGKLAEYASAGGSLYDFTAGTQDVGTFTGEEFAYLVLTGESGVSKSTRGISTIAFLGIEEWYLTEAVDTVAVATSHVGTAPVVIYGNGGNDILKMNGFTADLTIALGQEIGGIGLTVHDFYRIETGSGNDTFYGTDADSFFHGGTGKNLFYGSLGADTLYSDGDMVIDYSASAEAVALGYTGTSSSYKVYTGYGVDGSMSKGDVLRVIGTLEILGSIYDDSLSISGSRGTITSNGGNDLLIGGSGNDTLIGADGYAETMRPGKGNDIVAFGTGGGTLDLSTANSIATIDLAAGTFVFADGSYDIVSGEFERLIATDLNDQIHGTDDADWIIGGNGYDTIDAKGGDDIVTVVRGNVLGGAGNDILASSGGTSTLDGGAGDDTITVGTNSTAYGGEGNDTMTGGDGSYLYGGDGDDLITSSRLNVTVVGGAGADRIMFTTSYATSSVVSYADSATGVSLQYSTTGYHGIGGDAEGDLVTGLFSIVGSDFADVLLLQGLEGTEVHGGGGDDVIGIVSYKGTAYGGAGDDTITLNSRYHVAYGDADNDTFYGHGTMHGGAGDDHFYLDYGSYALGADSFTDTDIGGTVHGGSGVNLIVGSGGNDSIHMGEGTNTFVFSLFGGKDGVYSAGADDTIVFAGFEPVDSMEELLGYLVESGTKTVFDLGSTNAYPDIYGPSSNPSHLGSITFYGMTAAQVAAINWEFA